MITSTHHWRPEETPRTISWLITITCLVTLLSALLTPLFHLAQLLAPQEILSLSRFGMNSYFFWQPITYLFTQEMSVDGIDLFFLLALAFNMYILWMLGSILHTDIGTRHFLIIYLLTGALAGISAIFMQNFTGQYTFLYGPTAALLALFTIWVMHYGDSILSLFFLIPLKTKWILASILGAIILISLTKLDFVTITFYLSATFFAYLYGTIVLGLKSPYAFLGKIDEQLNRLHLWISGTKSRSSTNKIVNLKGEPILSDEEFIDAMLTKISRFGEKSLTVGERQRMEQISKRKRR